MSEISEKPSAKKYTRRRVLRLAAAAAAGMFIGVPDSVNLSTRESPALVNRELPPFPEFKFPNLDQSILVIPLGTPDDKRTPRKELAVEMKNVSTFFEENSYGRFHYSYKILPSREANLPTDRDNPYEVADIGDASLTAAELSFSDKYQTRLYVLNPDTDPKAGGFKIGAKDDYKRAIIYFPGADVIIHELGHTLGLGHADLLKPSIPDDYTHKIKVEEYASTGNLMGDILHGVKFKKDAVYVGGLGFHLNAAQKVELGWLGRDEVKDIAHDGEYTISTIEQVDQPVSTKALRIRKSDTNEFYWIDFRARYFGSAAPGLEIVKWNEKVESPTDQIDWNAEKEFHDKVNGIKIEEVSRDVSPTPTGYSFKGTVRIKVTFDK